MGAIAEAIVAYAQPLLDQSQGSVENMNRAMTLAEVCWNLALLPEDRRDEAIDKMKPAFQVTDEEFAEFRQLVVLPMIQRHREMFPEMHLGSRQIPNTVDVAFSPTGKDPKAGRNAPCPCGSGRKYKRCCGARR